MLSEEVPHALSCARAHIQQCATTVRPVCLLSVGAVGLLLLFHCMSGQGKSGVRPVLIGISAIGCRKRVSEQDKTARAAYFDVIDGILLVWFPESNAQMAVTIFFIEHSAVRFTAYGTLRARQAWNLSYVGVVHGNIMEQKEMWALSLRQEPVVQGGKIEVVHILENTQKKLQAACQEFLAVHCVSVGQSHVLQDRDMPRHCPG